MPELPEVETVARGLRPELVGRTLGASAVRWTRTLGGLTRAAFARGIDGARVCAVGRRAKWIVIELERAQRPAGALFTHLRMTGRMQVDGAQESPGPWERVRIALDDGRVLRFIDPRKFGRVLFSTEAESVVGELGPEPLGAAFTLPWFRAALGSRRRLLKPLLLDQTFLAGLGNIYVDESLHRAGLHPLLSSERVNAAQAAALRRSIRSVLAAAIEREGSSFDAFYRTPAGKPGSYQHLFQVYARTGEPCRTCSTPIRYFKVGQRGTHLCPQCQPRPTRRRAATRKRGLLAKNSADQAPER